MNEVFKSVPEWENMYEVSNFGRVKSIERVVKSNSGTRLVKERFLKLHLDKKGYKVCSLSINGFLKSFKIHRLVALTFIANPENKPEVNHKDGNKQNNHVDNLEWNTSSENQLHAYKNNLTPRNKALKGEASNFSKLTEQQVLEIRDKYIPRKYTREMLAKEYNISSSNISYIINRVNWKHI